MMKKSDTDQYPPLEGNENYYCGAFLLCIVIAMGFFVVWMI